MQVREKPGASRPYALQLPLDDGGAGDLAHLRLEHLGGVNGVTRPMLTRLARAFPSLRAVYSAPEADLARVIGPIAAARVRWFLDAPIDTRLAADATGTAPPQHAPTSTPKQASMLTAA